MKIRGNGVTMIELLLAVGGISVLVAAVSPNLLRQGVLSDVSRVMDDERALAMANEAYHTDWNNYAIDFVPAAGLSLGEVALRSLSTPVAYISDAWPLDPFANPTMTESVGTFGYHNYDWVERGLAFGGSLPGGLRSIFGDWWQLAWDHKYYITSPGPTRFFKTTLCVILGDGNCGVKFTAALCDGLDVYDPTNGTISDGQIMRTALGNNTGQLRWPGGTQWDMGAYLARTNADANLPPTAIPTLGEWGLIAMMLLLLMSGAVIITRRMRLDSRG